MNSLKEVSDFISKIPVGEAIFNIYKDYGELCVSLPEWSEFEEMRKSSNWIEHWLSGRLRRGFNASAKKMILTNSAEIVSRFKDHVLSEALHILSATSNAEKPKRTSVYKQMQALCYDNAINQNLVDDLIPIINYYYSHVYDNNSSPIHRNNVFNLLTIIGSKHYARANDKQK